MRRAGQHVPSAKRTTGKRGPPTSMQSQMRTHWARQKHQHVHELKPGWTQPIIQIESHLSRMSGAQPTCDVQILPSPEVCCADCCARGHDRVVTHTALPQLALERQASSLRASGARAAASVQGTTRRRVGTDQRGALLLNLRLSHASNECAAQE
jgi:hypothetical protein